MSGNFILTRKKRWDFLFIYTLPDQANRIILDSRNRLFTAWGHVRWDTGYYSIRFLSYQLSFLHQIFHCWIAMSDPIWHSISYPIPIVGNQDTFMRECGYRIIITVRSSLALQSLCRPSIVFSSIYTQ